MEVELPHLKADFLDREVRERIGDDFIAGGDDERLSCVYPLRESAEGRRLSHAGRHDDELM